jgi:plastocyanin
MYRKSKLLALVVFMLLFTACKSATPTQAPAPAEPTATSTATPVPPSATPAPTDTATPTVQPTDTATPTLAAGATAAPAGGKVNIIIIGLSFVPNPMIVKVGTTVTWTNQDAVAHKVVADNGSFKSGTLKKGNSYSFTFTQVGTFKYYCSFHGGPNGAGMSGKIVVMQ